MRIEHSMLCHCSMFNCHLSFWRNQVARYLPAGWLTFDGAAPAPNVCPSAKVTETKIPPGSPLINGRPTTLTLSPTFTELDFQPLLTRYAGGFISKFQR